MSSSSNGAATSVGTIAPIIKINGVELSTDLALRLSSVRISLGLRIPGRTVLEFDDFGFAVSAGGSITMGAPVTISVSGGDTPLFDGEITGINLDLDRGHPMLSVVADDPSYKLTLGTKVRTFTNMSYSQIVSQIGSEIGVSVDADSTPTTYEYLIQSDTDFGFINEMADRVGYDWWVDSTRTLNFKKVTTDGAVVATLGWGEGLTSFSVRMSGLHPGTVKVLGWDPKQKQAVSGDSAPSSVGTNATLAQTFLAASSAQNYSPIVSTFDSPGSTGDAKELADRAVTRWRSGAVTATGECQILPALVPGQKIQITDAGPASGTYDVTGVDHVYSARGFVTHFSVGERQPRGLADTLSGPRGSSFRQTGLMIGVVTNNADPDSGGRVKVKLPALGATVESQWARVVTVGGGNQRGITFLPEVNDEVIVGFEAGDVTRPVVIGGVYNGRDKGKDFGTANNAIQKRQIVSRLGHIIEMGDGDGDADQHIGLTLAGGAHQIYVGKDKLLAKIPSGIPATVQAGESKMEIDAQGNMTLQAKKITIKADTDVEIQGMNITAKANAKVELTAAVQLKMSANAQAELSSGGQTAVKGAIVMIN